MDAFKRPEGDSEGCRLMHTGAVMDATAADTAPVCVDSTLLETLLHG